MTMISQLGLTLSVSQTSSSFQEDFENTSLFEAMTRIALQNELPLGLVVSNDHILCSNRSKFSISGSSLGSALENAAKEVDYQVNKEHGVIVIAPRHLSAEEARILNLKLENFAPPPAPMHLLGSFLLTYTWGTLHPKEGTIADVPLSRSAKDVQLPPIPHSTLLDNANRIASQDGGGLWVVTFSARSEKENSKRAVDLESLSIFSYNDDALMIHRFSCQPPPSK
jgi:hypothetical protein